MAERPTDAYLQHIVRIQVLVEDADNILQQPPLDAAAKAVLIRGQLEAFKTSLSFSLSQCLVTYDAQLAAGLATVVTASRSLISFMLNMTLGEEFVVTNMAWVMLSCGMSLAVRLDVLLRDGRIAPLAQHLGHVLDIQHSMRQIILRLESAASAYASNEAASENTFQQFLQRARAIESWHAKQLPNIVSPSLSLAGLRPSHAPENASSLGPMTNMSFHDADSTATSMGIDAGLDTPSISMMMLHPPSSMAGTAEPLGGGDEMDFSVLDVLFDGQTSLFNPYMLNM
ncbi:hypothetical protein SBRCBS47491_006931 [Sporothrix bragantina]|uniref:C6 transcription factor n=1 Tax=Sporothrix bragantina TaxID=671064 RepID=A0ABP0CBJ2_9PEZI